MKIQFLEPYRGYATGEVPYQRGEVADLPQPLALRVIGEGAAATAEGREMEPDPPVPLLPYQPLVGTPASHRVVAAMSTYNDADCIEWVIRRALAQGIELVVFDNWSSDATYEIVRQLCGERGMLDLLRFPPDGPTRRHNFQAFIRYFRQVLHEFAPDAWHMWHASDEAIISPWRGVPYRDALWRVQQAGFNVVDHHYLDFWPTTNLPPFQPGGDMVQSLLWFELRNPLLERAWYAPGCRVESQEVGHEVWFKGKRVYPTRFILKNYRYRSQEHADRKRAQRQARLREYKWGMRHCSSYFLEALNVVKEPGQLWLWRDGHWLTEEVNDAHLV